MPLISYWREASILQFPSEYYIQVSDFNPLHMYPVIVFTVYWVRFQYHLTVTRRMTFYSFFWGGGVNLPYPEIRPLFLLFVTFIAFSSNTFMMSSRVKTTTG